MQGQPDGEGGGCTHQGDRCAEEDQDSYKCAYHSPQCKLIKGIGSQSQDGAGDQRNHPYEETTPRQDAVKGGKMWGLIRPATTQEVSGGQIDED